MAISEDADLAKIAEGMGCAAIKVDNPVALRAALQKALTMNQPVVIDAISDENALAPTAWTPGGGGAAH